MKDMIKYRPEENFKMINSDDFGLYPLSLEVKCAGNKGLGLFSKQFISNQTNIGFYEGDYLNHKTYSTRYNSSSSSEYVFLLNPTAQRRFKVYIDARNVSMSNLTRYMNHDNVNPNVQAFIVDTSNDNKSKNMHSNLKVLFIAIRDIEIGDELLFDYGISYDAEWI